MPAIGNVGVARIEKAAANHVGDKNRFRPPWQAHFSLIHGIGV
jgi:hypothetical protein